MSPRAAWRLESLGFDRVHDYVGGKADWMAAGLPTVRANATERRAFDAAERHPPTCHLDTPLRDVRSGGSVIVVNEHDVVLGRIDEVGETGGDQVAADVMRPGPATVRADEPLDPLLARMRDQNVSEVVVTTPEGRLLGVVHAS